jgi:hypothetical protein
VAMGQVAGRLDRLGRLVRLELQAWLDRSAHKACRDCRVSPVLSERKAFRASPAYKACLALADCLVQQAQLVWRDRPAQLGPLVRLVLPARARVVERRGRLDRRDQLVAMARQGPRARKAYPVCPVLRGHKVHRACRAFPACRACLVCQALRVRKEHRVFQASPVSRARRVPRADFRARSRCFSR